MFVLSKKLCVFFISFVLLVPVLLPDFLVSAQNSKRKSAIMKSSGEKFVYPKARKSDQVDDYHGVKVADPYRWLEDPDSQETRAWIEAQNKLTFGYLNTIPERAKIKARLTKLWNFERYDAPFREGGRYFFTKNDGLQNQSVLYTMKNLTDTPKVLLDPNKLSKDGTVALAGTYISDNGKLMAYGLSGAGSDWVEFRVRDIESRKDLSDVVKWVKFSGASWTKDNKGFFYSRYPEPNEITKLEDTNYFQKVYYHRIGTPQSEDTLVYDRPDNKELGFGASVTEDGRYLIIYVYEGTDTRNRLYYKDLTNPNSEVVRLLDDFDATYSLIGNDGAVFWFYTTLNAPRGRVIEIDTRNPARSNWKEIIPQADEAISENGYSLVGNQFFINYMKDAYSKIKAFDLKGKMIRDVELPGIGTAYGFYGKKNDNETFYSYTSFTTPTTIYRYDVLSGQSSLFRQPKVAFVPNNFEAKQVFFKSLDGTRVPMFIVHKKGLKLDGNNPTFLYGYGGFNVSLTPSFSISRVVWMEMGGIYVLANIRGGGEYGEEWHQAGMKLKKQNVFDDFIGAAEWLIENKYTSPSKLAINGGSNGGLLIGAVVNQRPDLFGAAIPAVGVMDMLRFHKFTIGYAWTSDYGSPENAEEFKSLYAYSPIHNIKAGVKYPPTLIITADHDDRVVPAHSFKYAATLQAAQGGSAPILIRIETKAGHGAGKPTSKTIEELSDIYGFLVKTLNVRVRSGN
jgi:prolyl oligopeptidase